MRRLTIALIPIAFAWSSALAQQATETTDRLVPTIPESQIEPAPLSSGYEFLYLATAANEFVIKSAELATAQGGPEVKPLSAELAAAHAAIMKDAGVAGKADSVDIAAPSPDGDQQGLLQKMQALTGAEFDLAYVESQLYTLQRTIAYFRGYGQNASNLSDTGGAGNLGAFAEKTLPTLVAQYGSLAALKDRLAAAQPAPQ